MDAGLEIRPLSPDDADALIRLRREALESHPLAFWSSPEDDKGLSLDFVRESLAEEREGVVLGVLSGAELVGMLGVTRYTKRKRRHIADIWSMYVAPRARRRGAGRGLLEAAIEHARAWPDVEQLHLGVSESAVEAHRLYESAGFREWGREPRAFQWEGRFVDMIYLMLDLGGEAAES